VYISKEEMTQWDEEAAAAAPAPDAMAVVEPAPTGVVSNWRYFWAGESLWSRGNATMPRTGARSRAERGDGTVRDGVDLSAHYAVRR
jgi:hypothetical protein